MIRKAMVAAVLALVSVHSIGAQDANLGLGMRATPDPVADGQELVYTIVVTNAGPGIAIAPSLHQQLPAGTGFSTADPECSYSAFEHGVDCDLADIDPGQSRTIDVRVIAGEPAEGPSVGVWLSGAIEGSGPPAVFLLDGSSADRKAISTADLLVAPHGLAREPEGGLVVADVRDPSPTGGGGAPLFDGAIVRIDRSTGAQIPVSQGDLLVNPTGIAVAPDGTIFVADPDALAELVRGRVIAVDPVSGAQSVVGELDLLERPTGIAVEETGTLLVADAAGRLLRLDPADGSQTLISSGGLLLEPLGVASEGPDAAVIADGTTGVVRVDLATGVQTLVAAVTGFEIVRPSDIAVAPGGDLWVADPTAFDGGAILQLSPTTGEILTAYLGGVEMIFSSPSGIELFDTLYSTATISTESSEEDTTNNTDFTSTEIVAETAPEIVEIVVIETITASDQVGLQTSLVLQVTESIGVADAVSVSPAVMISISEAIGVTDTVSAGPLPPVVITINENVGVVDQIGLRPALVLQITESVGVADTINVTPAVVISISESVGVTDSVSATPLPPVVITINENVGVVDQIGLRPALVLQITESVGVADTINVTPAVVISVAESVGVTDSVSAAPLPPVVITINESIGVVDLVEISVEDGEPPRVVRIHTVADTGDGILGEGETTRAAITQLLVTFSAAVADPPGDGDPDDVTNPANFLLISDGGDGVFNTVDCASGWSPNDVPVEVGPVVYLEALDLAAVSLSAGSLPAGHYRLHVCGTTSITSPGGTPLDGNGDGQGGDDFRLSFTVAADQLVLNPNLDSDLSHWEEIAPGGEQVEHGSADVGDAPTSGSVHLDNVGATGEAGIAQCVPVHSTSRHRLGVELAVMNTAATPATPRLEIEWFPDDACQLPPLESKQLYTGPIEPDLWNELAFVVLPPSGSSSAKIRLMVEAEDAESYEAYWDDVTFFADPTVIFADGFESGDDRAWAASP